MDKFVRVHIFKEDYRMLMSRFSHDEIRPARGVLVHNALNRILDLEDELDDLNAAIRESKK